MKNEEMKMKRYLRAVRRRLNLPVDVKKRVMADFESAVRSRREAGKSDAEIYDELGKPKCAALELNRQMKEFAYRKSPWRWACLAAMVVSVLVLLYELFHWALLRNFTDAENASIGIIGGADGPTAIIVASSGSFACECIAALAVLVLGAAGFLVLSRLKGKGNRS